MLTTDLRLSINVETKNEIKNKEVSKERIKERTSFEIGWMRIDLTEVKEKYGNIYECEIEV